MCVAKRRNHLYSLLVWFLILMYTPAGRQPSITGRVLGTHARYVYVCVCVNACIRRAVNILMRNHLHDIVRSCKV